MFVKDLKKTDMNEKQFGFSFFNLFVFSHFAAERVWSDA